MTTQRRDSASQDRTADLAESLKGAAFLQGREITVNVTRGAPFHFEHGLERAYKGAWVYGSPSLTDACMVIAPANASDPRKKVSVFFPGSGSLPVTFWVF